MCSSHCTIETRDRTDRTEFIPPVPLCHRTLGIGWDWSQVYHMCSSHCTIETWDRTDRTEFIPPVPLCHGTLGMGWEFNLAICYFSGV